MFECAETLLIQLIQYVPYLVCIILVLNLIAYLLWGGK